MALAKKVKQQDFYKRFDQLDGSHPFKKVLPEGFVDYPARIRKGGKVSYFNFTLAKEMGLIPADHDGKITPELEAKILQTFSIQIINEFDQEQERKFPEADMKSGTYMATRYLQLQHDNKQGKTSGDGRSVWNGQVKYRSKVWDISSGGTGATKLSPATSKFGRYFETGDPTISYGCGYAEVDEGFATAILSRVFNQNNYSTERSLAIIEFKNNISINIRAHRNLIRPSHMFLYLKQDDHQSLKSIVDYYIERQRESEVWKDCPQNYRKYDFFLNQIKDTFAKLSARFEDDYIFCWLDWDGDNILMDGGIIDYGSVRQFGLCHYEYRYDDVERFSTNLYEQKTKAKYIVQTFAQVVNYIRTKEKGSITDFANHEVLNSFEDVYENQKDLNLLHRLGLSERKVKQVQKRDPKLVENLRKSFSYFEKMKTKKGEVKISDGKTWDAIFNMRDLLRELPQAFMLSDSNLVAEQFVEIMTSSLASKEDLEINSYKKQKIEEFQKLYKDIIKKTAKIFQETEKKTLLDISRRSQVINKPNRITGDATTFIINEILKKRKELSNEKINNLLNALEATQNLNPDHKVKFPQKYPEGILNKFMEIIEEHREGI